MKRNVYANRTAANRASQLPNPPTLIEYKRMKFLIMDAPSEGNLPLYLKELEKNHVTNLVRVCEPTYSKEPVEQQHIKVHDWLFPDGEAPPVQVVQNWLALVNTTFKSDASIMAESPAIAVHCIAGLGRAPVLVALALIEAGMEPLESVEFIRNRRHGAINQNQLKFLEMYYRRKKGTSKCTIM